MTIRLAMNGRFFPGNWRPAAQEIAFAHSAGFCGIQFNGERDGLAAARLGQPLDEVQQQLAAAGLEAVMEIVVRVGRNGRTEEGYTPLDVLRHNLPAISALYIRAAHWHLVLTEEIAAAEMPRFEESFFPQLAAAVEDARQVGCVFGLEHNSADSPLPFFSAPDRMAMALTAVPGLGLVWDFNHTPLSQVEAYQALTPRMSMLHVSDAPLPHLNYHWGFGRGHIDYAAYLQQLIADGFAGIAVLEIGGTPWSGGFGQDSDAALIQSHQLFTQAVAQATAVLDH